MRLVVLDRDGVINVDSAAFVKNADEWLPIPGSLEAIGRLNQAGYTVAIATNQSGIGRGLFSEQDLHDQHAKMQSLLAEHDGRIDYITYCPHHPDAGCECRKPRPGLFRQIAKHYGLENLAGVPIIGDALRDLQAGQQLGCSPMLVKTGKGEKTLAAGVGLEDAMIFTDLAAAVEHILA